MISVHLLPLIIAVVAIGSSEAIHVRIGSSNLDERCLPIRHCSPVYKRVATDEHKRNHTFLMELRRSICTPVVQMDNKTHISCPKPHIECNLNGKKGACLLREHCPTLHSTTEQKLMRSVQENLCYVHDGKKYFCCTDALCASNKKLCDEEEWKQQNSSAFPNCTSGSGAVGSLVPRILCTDQTRSTRSNDANPVCCVPPSPDRLISHPNAAKLAQTFCGSPGIVDNSQNDKHAQRGEFPWMAKLVYNSNSVCGGTLIHPLYVLTLRQCINTRVAKVQLGIYDLQEYSRCSSRATRDRDCHQQEVQEINILKTFRHDVYDVGLLRLVKPAIVEGDSVRPICLPIYSSLRMYLPPTVTITGWGMTEQNILSNVLLKADTPVLPDEKECKKDHIICVGGVNHSNHCPGDAGGPYQALSKFGTHPGGRFVQYGIIQSGTAYCSHPDRPSQGVLVGYVIDWILDQMEL